jgi:hypothetical protein
MVGGRSSVKGRGLSKLVIICQQPATVKHDVCQPARQMLRGMGGCRRGQGEG